MDEKITTSQMVDIIENMAATMQEQKGYLSELDGAIGDGDHGVNMAKCFRQVRESISQGPGEDVGEVLKNVGMVVLNSVGGAMGALYGTFFLRMSQEARDKTEVGLSDLVAMFKAAEQGIRDRGDAEVGDKTMLDTLAPAVEALEEAEQQDKTLADALSDFEQAARQGMESTQDMIAKVGRASRLGERTLGHQDAGATSCYFILRAFAHSMGS